MVDKFSGEVRSKIMKSIKSISKMEDKVSKELWKRGFRFRRNIKDLPGKPDIAINKYKSVVFLDSCYWHLCEIHGHIPQSNIEYWSKKLLRNKERDRMNTELYIDSGWHILRIWEHQIKDDFNDTVDTIAAFLQHAKNRSLRLNPNF
ncbi:DNA mismatch endonuclease Vsr [Paenibacillus vortex V453]|uniref:Very short patch repair endonuclease n=1 Tax=Paenibacillus vortex V453 TaxID=715225 RepID=A0A2R9T2I9_9BACL|nr:very short patch repair endonuclease [Paenibacillus vortex]EFU43868.1 DNA mismatch endonuclease Vsr [Paenibacillus vortex V453]